MRKVIDTEIIGEDVMRHARLDREKLVFAHMTVISNPYMAGMARMYIVQRCLALEHIEPVAPAASGCAACDSPGFVTNILCLASPVGIMGLARSGLLQLLIFVLERWTLLRPEIRVLFTEDRQLTV